jgi:CRP/FNR family cyclic AMP-dependent transcriptional regulator
LEKLKLKAGETLFAENSSPDFMYFVMDGEIEISMKLNSEKIILTNSVKGDEFGELGLLLGTPRSATAVAIKPAELIALDQSELIQKIRREPDFAVKIIRKLAGKLTNANEVIKEQISLRRSLEITYGKLLAERKDNN